MYECTKLFKNIKVCANLIQNFQDDSDDERPLTICSTNSLGQKGSHPLPIAAAPTKPTIQIRPLSQMQPTQQPFIAILPPVSSLLASASSNLQTSSQVNIKNGRYTNQANEKRVAFFGKLNNKTNFHIRNWVLSSFFSDE